MNMWGLYPAVLGEFASMGRIVGVAYEVKSQEEKEKLAAYETGVYREKGVVVHFWG